MFEKVANLNLSVMSKIPTRINTYTNTERFQLS